MSSHSLLFFQGHAQCHAMLPLLSLFHPSGSLLRSECQSRNKIETRSYVFYLHAAGSRIDFIAFLAFLFTMHRFITKSMGNIWTDSTEPEDRPLPRQTTPPNACPTPGGHHSRKRSTPPTLNALPYSLGLGLHEEYSMLAPSETEHLGHIPSSSNISASTTQITRSRAIALVWRGAIHLCNARYGELDRAQGITPGGDR